MATVALGTTTGIAKTGAPGAGRQSSDVQADAKPSGYLVVYDDFSAPNGQQTGGVVACPLTKKGATREALGGGVDIFSGSLGANINSSFPSGTSWSANVNNNSGNFVGYRVWAVCAKPHKNYQVVDSSIINNPAGTQSEATAVCPKGTKVTGGGAINSSNDLAVNINSSIPTSNGWRSVASNASASSNTLTTYAVCSGNWGTPTGYNIAVGTAVTNSAGRKNNATVTCASGQSVLGGGGLSGSGSTSVNMATTRPFTGAWSVYENNNTAGDTTITAYAVCAT